MANDRNDASIRDPDDGPPLIEDFDLPGPGEEKVEDAPPSNLWESASRNEKRLGLALGIATVLLTLFGHVITLVVGSHLARNSVDATIQARIEGLRTDLRIMDARLRSVELHSPRPARADTTRPDSSS